VTTYNAIFVFTKRIMT